VSDALAREPYFRSKNGSREQNFWKYYDLRTNAILDNRYVLASLIACSFDTPRIVDQETHQAIFEIQEGTSAFWNF
jgi:hypothetical protein